MKSRKIKVFTRSDIKKIKEKYEKDLLLLPHVVGVGIGYKITQEREKNTLCLKVYVSKKTPSKELSKNKTIPTQLDGILTDVEEIGMVKAYA
ncbi:MAG: hypothetical protein A2Y00_03035 [Omnitrophica WOR_2 bacterium GWF2_43_52]|nr:MAG: hypothetical protein A2062_01045 [Omnitrophica WOR_2 bacterium GWA2_44_7]OGX22410.1 MAG: hypothetical protein A2Y00_03035 [Omnitrophica WOR_2 bacterium GWF2_43_52]HAH20827.1 hypothetical protein [Candidatus Omnitrophota bacterium]HBG64495.1 hypothetical protein [Candidatus Omnitrophota bacterium]HCD38308.1 hypothetical protein [Candidatus Omnitrophota bacterium]